MNQSSRRRFISIIPVAGAAMLMAGKVFAETAKVKPTAAASAPKSPVAAVPANMLDPKSPSAVSLGYAEDATKGDKVKLKNVAAGGNCSNCALFQAKAGDATGNCPLFAGKKVTAKGICSAYAKKA